MVLPWRQTPGIEDVFNGVKEISRPAPDLRREAGLPGCVRPTVPAGGTMFVRPDN